MFHQRIRKLRQLIVVFAQQCSRHGIAFFEDALHLNVDQGCQTCALFEAGLTQELRNLASCLKTLQVHFFSVETIRQEIFFGKQGEAMARRPVACHLGELAMSRITGVEAFRENVLEFRGQGIDMPNARRARRHALFRVLLELDEIEIITSIFHGRSFGQGRR